MKIAKFLTAAALLPAINAQGAAPETAIVATDSYKWVGDTIFQGEYKAFAVSPDNIESTYHAEPGFFMPIEQSWKLKNDISSYPSLKSSNKLHQAIYNMGLDEMVNAVEPDTTLRTGKEWAGVWTRDVSYSIILSMACMQPEASRISLMKKVDSKGRIIQDTGSGGAWPISTDRMIWAVAAWEIYKVTGDKEWLKYIYPIIKRSVEADDATIYSPDGLVRGETTFIDWREQSYPKWMQTADIYNSEAIGTNVVHATTLRVLADVAETLGKKKEAALYAEKADRLAKTINDIFWMEDKGYYGMYRYGRNNPILNPRAETLGESLSIIYDIASPERARSITENNPTTPFGVGIFFPQIKDMPSYHNNALWPFVASYWAIANAKAKNEQGTLEAIGSVFRPAALFCTNKENFVLDNGDIATELNSSNMLWCLSGNLAITYRILFGIHFEKDGLRLEPFIPKALADTRTLTGFPYRKARLNITVEGYGSEIKECYINGKPSKPFIPTSAKGDIDVRIVMADNAIPELKVNHTPNVKAPLTPVVHTSTAADGTMTLTWDPIEYIAGYKVLRNGKTVTTTRSTEYVAAEPGEYQVIGFDGSGVESFASMPVSNEPVEVFQFATETTSAVSPEISYAPEKAISGFHGAGFVETDHTMAVPSTTIEVPEDGIYAVSVRYANGNGPVNTENKAAIRSLTIDGAKAGSIVMPHRGTGNWWDWGMSNAVIVPLKAGRHTVAFELRDTDENMNIHTNHALIDEVEVRHLAR